MMVNPAEAAAGAARGIADAAALERIDLVVERLSADAGLPAAEVRTPSVLRRFSTPKATDRERCIIIVPEQAVGLALPPDGRPPRLVGLKEMDQVGPAVVLEPVRHANASALLMLNPLDVDIRVNGLDAPPLDVLAAGDQFDWGAGLLVHVAVFNRPRVGKLRPDMFLRECAVCSLPIGEAAAYLCPCGAVCHSQGEETLPDQRLECAKLSPHCPACGRAKVFTPGYERFPELIDEPATFR